jgi:hypothetical protein
MVPVGAVSALAAAEPDEAAAALDALPDEELLSRLPQAVARRPTAAIAATA